MISRIKEIDPANDNISRILVLSQSLSARDQKVLLEEFGHTQAMIDKMVRLYRNIGLVLELKKSDEDGTDGFVEFAARQFPLKKESTKLDNTFISRSGDKMLLITNRRLVTIDLRNLNEKIRRINVEIDAANEELPDSSQNESRDPRSSLLQRFKSIFK